WHAGGPFTATVTMDDVVNGKPHPDGLIKILNGRDPRTALYMGDNIDDALAARDAGVPFLGVLAPGVTYHKSHDKKFRDLGALDLLPSVAALDAWLATNSASPGSIALTVATATKLPAKKLAPKKKRKSNRPRRKKRASTKRKLVRRRKAKRRV